MSLEAHVKGASDPTVAWALSGAGALTDTGSGNAKYVAPDAMPSNSSVTITARLRSSTSVSGTYTFTLVNATPTLYSAKTAQGPLTPGATNSVTVNGAGFVTGTTVTVNGASMPVTFLSSSSLQAQVTVAANASGTLSVVTHNPTPGGGASAAYQASVSTPSVQIAAYNVDGTNSGTGWLTRGTSLSAKTQGTGNSALVWSLSGAGTLSDQGSGNASYQAPEAMPGNSKVVITAALKSNAAVSTSYSLRLVNAVPTVYSAKAPKGALIPGTTNPVTINGAGFVTGTSVLVNGASVPVTFVSSTSLQAQVPVAANAKGSLQVVTQNPSPGGGASEAVQASVSTSSVQISAYSADGTNSGTCWLTRGISLSAATQGSGSSTLIWSLSGAGTLTDLGSGNAKYQAPDAMPSGSSVTITAKLQANTAISNSYSFTLINAVPTIYSVKTAQGPLIPATTNTTTINGAGFVAGTAVLVNGVSVPTTFLSSSSIQAQIQVAANASGTLPVVTRNPAPGGGSSASFPVSISSSSVQIFAYGVDGTNTGTGWLTRGISLTAKTQGTGNSTLIWSLSGAGTLTDLGSGNAKYQAPDAMPSNPEVAITAKLQSNTSVAGSYTLALINAVPVIYSAKTAQGPLMPAATNSVTINGAGFVTGTTVTVNGASVPVTFLSSGSVSAQVAVPANASGTMAVIANNPSPGGGASAAVNAAVGTPVIKLNAYSSNGANPSSVRLGLPVQFASSVSGAGSTTLPIQWQVQGAGSISSSGLYQAPATMPSSPNVSVIASLKDNPNANSSYQLALASPMVVVNGSSPAVASANQDNSLTLSGRGFLPTTTVTANGTAAATTYLSPTSLQVTFHLDANDTSASLVAQNSDPGANSSAAFVVPVGTSGTVSVTVGSNPSTKIPRDFLGFSHEWGDAQYFAGTAAGGVNTAYRQLVTNLMEGEQYSFPIRVGGSTTDKTTAPTSTTVSAFAELANAIPVRFSLGVNMGANDPQLAADQAKAYMNALPSSVFDAIELGNEPDDYANKGYRSNPYTASQFIGDTATWQSAILNSAPRSIKFTGPSYSTPYFLNQNLTAYEQQVGNNVSIVSQHGYIANLNVQTNIASDILLQPGSSTYVPSLVAQSVSQAHGQGQLFRMSEMNSIAGGGLVGVSDRFGAALWAVDTMFEYAKIGVDGVNWHGSSGCGYCAFTFGVQSGFTGRVFTLQNVSPVYYGMLFFRLATEHDSQLLPVTVGGGANLKAWATVDRDGVVHVTVINKDKSFAGKVAISLPGFGSGNVMRLVAPNYQSANGVSMGGQTFDGSVDGTIQGSQQLESVDPSSGVYTITMQPTSAALLTVTP